MKIDLAMSYESPMLSKGDSDEKHYPTFTYEGPEEIDVPKSGVMEVKFKKIASSMSERDGRKRYSCTFEVRAIEEVEPTDEDEPPTRTEDELDKLMERKMKEKEY